MNVKNITLGGISIALGVVILYLTNIMPISTISTLTVASCIIPIVIIRGNIKTSILVYLLTSIISFLILPLNHSIMYILLFGIYGIIKYFIEKLNKLTLEIIIKLIFFNIVLAIGYFIFNVFVPNSNFKFPIWIAIIAAQFVFLIYDYAMTLVITYYIKRFKA